MKYVFPQVVDTANTLRITYDTLQFSSSIGMTKPVANIKQVLVAFGWYPLQPDTEITISEDPITKEKVIRRYYSATAWTGRT